MLTGTYYLLQMPFFPFNINRLTRVNMLTGDRVHHAVLTRVGGIRISLYVLLWVLYPILSPVIPCPSIICIIKGSNIKDLSMMENSLCRKTSPVASPDHPRPSPVSHGLFHIMGNTPLFCAGAAPECGGGGAAGGTTRRLLCGLVATAGALIPIPR